ncbi:YqzE family protein [Alkalihalophilus pseudofirmus]|uniref:YqzE family protein n=1 Tax=Alkalihalobacterium alkalinitrilicum TaxID=427920 RepID=UPI00094D42BB|nr:YqzE family protein [Alkalihalobacterium alkalinitrilicum]OLO42877.1 YqzE family protein [Alkalihalophilus pseudofirmus]
MSSFNDYVKFVTQQFVTYVDRPKEERLAMKKQKKESKQPLQYQMFGMIPLALSMIIKRNRKKREK